MSEIVDEERANRLLNHIEDCSRKYIEKFYVEEDDHEEFCFMVKDHRRILCRCAIKENADVIVNALNKKESL